MSQKKHIDIKTSFTYRKNLLKNYLNKKNIYYFSNNLRLFYFKFTSFRLY